MEYELLSKINSPTDLKKLDPDKLPLLCNEIRQKLIKTISKNGGHLASNLGVVELTVALHRVFDSPDDSILFDVGHQSYTHKLLTGRFKDFDTIRTENGLSGFLRPFESIHDPFITGHSSNSISAAFGISRANALLNKDNKVVTVIGDGALTGGMAFEALNNIGQYKKNFIVVLNDNKMSISKNVGALAKHLNTIRSKPSYYTLKDKVEKSVVKIPIIGNKIRNSIFNSKMILKSAIYHSNIFEGLGFNYLGPYDGHDIKKIIDVLKIAKDQNKPVLIHAVTTKGKGYFPAEKKPDSFHGVSAFNIYTGENNNKTVKDFSTVCGDLLCDYASTDDKLCAVTAAMKNGTGLLKFSKLYKDRFFDVGIAEQHAVTFCAGAAFSGLHPVFVVYSSFLQRGYDQIIHDAAIQKLPLKLCIDRAGIVGEDGETHQGLFDVAFLSSIPGVKIYSPSCYDEMKVYLYQSIYNDRGVSAVRYPRGIQPDLPGDYIVKNEPFSFYGDLSSDIAIVTYGVTFSEACKAKEELKLLGINICIIKLNKIFPIENALISHLSGFKKVYFFEEGIKSGGISEHLASMLLTNKYSGEYKIIAIDNEFVAQSTVKSARAKYKLDSNSMIKIVCEG